MTVFHNIDQLKIVTAEPNLTLGWCNFVVGVEMTPPHSKLSTTIEQCKPT